MSDMFYLPFQLTALTPHVLAMAPVLAASVTVRLAGKASTVPAWTNRSTSAYPAAQTMEATTWRVEPASAKTTGQDRTVHKVI